MNKQTLYLLVFSISLAGFIWIGIHFIGATSHTKEVHIETCPIKLTTGAPCPSCGTTRSVSALLSLDFATALYHNPLGILMLVSMIIFPVWISIDWLKGSSGFYHFFHWVNHSFKKKRWFIPGIFLIIAIWFWNMYKHFS